MILAEFSKVYDWKWIDSKKLKKAVEEWNKMKLQIVCLMILKFEWEPKDDIMTSQHRLLHPVTFQFLMKI